MKDLKLKGVSVVGRGSGATLKYSVGPSQNPGRNPGGGGGREALGSSWILEIL